ncbi:MAG: hypothetical protein C0599_10255 [Salinivirgaceae bacterium]|nr:MAG: hypothetical protein C0599_10255 [Salinivirgaceae bacterium]
MKLLKKIGLLYLGAVILTLIGYGLDKDPLYNDGSLILLEFFIMSIIIFAALSILFGIIYFIQKLYRGN